MGTDVWGQATASSMSQSTNLFHFAWKEHYLLDAYLPTFSNMYTNHEPKSINFVNCRLPLAKTINLRSHLPVFHNTNRNTSITIHIPPPDRYLAINSDASWSSKIPTCICMQPQTRIQVPFSGLRQASVQQYRECNSLQPDLNGLFNSRSGMQLAWDDADPDNPDETVFRNICRSWPIHWNGTCIKQTSRSSIGSHTQSGLV